MKSDLSGKLLIIRADADVNIGTGHVMRCLALAQAWQERGGRVIFSGRIESDKLRQRLSSQGFSVVGLGSGRPDDPDADGLSALRELYGNDHEPWLVLDGYRFSAEYQQRLRDSGLKLLVLDDYVHLPAYQADILLNQNIGSDRLAYTIPAESVLMLGSAYVLLRREFRGVRSQLKNGVAPRAGRILVTMGGADPDNVTLKVIEALKLAELPGLEAKIIVGPANQHLEELQKSLGQASFAGEILCAVEDMVPVMHWADVAISAGGGTCWELACLGVPALVITLAANQLGVAKGMAEACAGVDCGWADSLTPERLAGLLEDLCGDVVRRLAMQKAGRALVDGQGAARVVERMAFFPFSFRPAGPEDCRPLFELANDPVVRNASFKREKIGWEEHRQWFSRRMQDKNCLFWIPLVRGDQAAGQVRFDIAGDEAVISASLATEYRNAGLGSRMINLACRKLYTIRKLNRIKALVIKENVQSLKAFGRAGFKVMREDTVKGLPTVVMTFEDYLDEPVSAHT